MKVKEKQMCPQCGSELGASDNNDCCDVEIVRRIIEEKMNELIEHGKEPAVHEEWVIERIKERIHRDRLLRKGREAGG